MDISYTDLRCKDVVNVVNGAKMGKIIDLIVDTKCKTVLGLVVPGVRKILRATKIFLSLGTVLKKLAVIPY